MGTSGSDEPGLSRREALKRGLKLGGTVLWVAPIVQTIGMTDAFAQAPSGSKSPIQQGSAGNPAPAANQGDTSGFSNAGRSSMSSGPGTSPSQAAPVSGTLQSAGSRSDIGAPADTAAIALEVTSASASQPLAGTGQNTKRLVELGGATALAGAGLAALARERHRPAADGAGDLGNTEEPSVPPAP